MSAPNIGFGTLQPNWVLHIANRPELDCFQHDIYRQLQPGEAADIIKQTSNHWRKVFSIMAKISFALFETNCTTWQQYRDTKLLTGEGFEAISFEPYKPDSNAKLSVICGFTYAETQVQLETLIPHIEQPKILMAVSKDCLVTPYFDWRQLNNEILAHLTSLMGNLLIK